MHAKALSFLFLPCLLLASACSDNGTAAQTLTPISGRVVAGPVAGADVTVLPLLNTGALGNSLGSGTTDSSGYFSFDASGYVGPALIVARGGTYVDEATGDTVVAPDLEMASLLVLGGAEAQTANVTVATTIAARRAMVLATEPTIDALSALENGIAMVEEYYGIQGIVTMEPADLTAGTVLPGPEADYGALNAGFSQLAADQGTALWSLISELAQDASDGMFDGHFFAGPLYTDQGDLPTTSGGADLRDATAKFMDDNLRNASGIDSGGISVDQSIDDHVTDPEYSVGLHQPRIDVVDPPLGVTNEVTEVRLQGQFPDLKGVSLVVTFGGEVAEIVDGKWTEEEIYVRTPAVPFPGKVDVEVRCENTDVHGVAPQAFEYYVPDLDPVITSVTPDRGPEAGGTLIEVTGRDFDPKSIVEVNGTQTDTIARLGRTVLIVVAPPGTGVADVTVRQADADGSPSATVADAFSYFGQGTGDEPAEADLLGPWKAYGLGHQYGPDTVMLVESDIAFLADGTYTQDADMWFANPDVAEGWTDTMTEEGPFRVFADGTLWMTPAGEPLASRSFLTPEKDVFIVANDSSTSGPMWLGAGIRRASGMSDGSLTGNWYFGLFTHAYALDPDNRMASSAWGTAEFDGAGHGSAGLIGALCVADEEDAREAFGSSLTYHVNPDGTFTITIPAEEGDEPVVFRGSLTQARDLGIAVNASGGQAQLLMMVPCPTGFTPAHAQGSWYGGGLAYEYYSNDGGSHFHGETIRSLADGEGRGVAEVVVRLTSDESGNEGMETETHMGQTLCETNGFLIGGPDDLSGFISASRRFQISVPANLEASPYEDAVRFMGAALLLRRPATYSTFTLDDKDYNAVGISTEYKAPGTPLSLEEENTSFRTRLHFDASMFPVRDQGALVLAEDPGALVGSAREYEGRTEKTIHRWTLSDIDVSQPENPPYWGWYAVLGDGRILMSVDEQIFDTLAASEEDLLEQVVGELTGNADLILLRNAVNPDGASAMIALAPTGDPILDGTYNGGALRFSYGAIPQLAVLPPAELAEAGFGRMVLDWDLHTLRGDGTVYAYDPVTGMSVASLEDWADTPFSVYESGFVTLTHNRMVLNGIATPDGSAIFLVDLERNFNTTFFVGLKQPAPSSILAAGSYRFEGFAHEYAGIGALPVEANKRVASGPGRITNNLDAGVTVDERDNAFAHVDGISTLFSDNNLAVNPDGSVSWNRGSEVYRGWFAANGRYVFMLPTVEIDFGDETVVVPDGFSLYMAIR